MIFKLEFYHKIFITMYSIPYTRARPNDVFLSAMDLALALLKIEIFLPSPLRQNLDKNQNLDKQINPFHIQITLTM